MTEKQTDELWDQILFLTEKQAHIALLAIADGKDLQVGMEMAGRYGELAGEQKGGGAYGENKKMEG